MDVYFIQEKFKKNNIQILPRVDNLNLWEKTLNQLNCLDHYQSNSYLNYQNEYHKNTCQELSFVALKEDKPLFIFPLFYNFKDAYFHNFDELIKLPKTNAQDDITNIILSIFYKKKAFFLNLYENQKEKFCKVGSCQTLNINLKNDIDKIFSEFRKSYKSLIRKELTDIKMTIVYKKDCSKEWEEFKKLHLFLAGKITRSDKSWNIQKENILNGKGLFIYFKKDDQLISGAFFDLTDQDIKYSVSLTHDDFLKNNCNHKSIYEAIKFGNEKKIQNLYLGSLKENEKNEKIKNIFFFKKGFCAKSEHNNIYRLK